MMVGDSMGRLLEEQQAMKMASAEALYETSKPADLSLFAVAGFSHNPGHTNVNIAIPHGLSLMSGGWNKEVRGINDIQAEYEQRYGPGDYTPVVSVTYWTFRMMIGAGSLLLVLTLVGAWLMRRRRLESTRWYLKAAIAAIVLPYIANSAGWIFTEMGRQPWAVQGLLLTKDAVSPGTTSAEILVSMTGFIVLYGALAVFGGRVLLALARKGPGDKPLPPAVGADGRRDLTLAY
jgi:cytochrome d ubiquinol oxidase subunit I